MGGRPAKRTILLLAGSQDIVRSVSYPLEQLLCGRYNVESILDNVFSRYKSPDSSHVQKETSRTVASWKHNNPHLHAGLSEILHLIDLQPRDVRLNRERIADSYRALEQLRYMTSTPYTAAVFVPNYATLLCDAPG